MSDYDPVGRPLDEALNCLARQGQHPMVVQTFSPLASQAPQANRCPRVIARRTDALVVAWFDIRLPEHTHA